MEDRPNLLGIGDGLEICRHLQQEVRRRSQLGKMQNC